MAEAERIRNEYGSAASSGTQSQSSGSEAGTGHHTDGLDAAIILGDQQSNWKPGRPKDGEGGREKAPVQPASFLQMMRYGTALDWSLLFLGFFCNVLGGFLTPLSSVIFFDLTTILTQAQADYDGGVFEFAVFRNQLLRPVVLYLGLGVASFLVVYVGMAGLYAVSERQVDILRKKFLFSVLHQDIKWFDDNEVGKLTQKLSSNVDRIRDGTSDKLGIVIQSISCALSGFAIGFVLSWKMTLVMLVMLPIMLISLVLSGWVTRKSLQREMEAYGSASAVAEEVISGVRTVSSMNGQEFELERYGSKLREGCTNGQKKQLITAIATGAVMFLLFAFMGLAFWVGTTLVMEGSLKTGIVFGCFWAVMVGIIRMGQALPQIATVVGARMAMGELLELIDQVPDLDCCSDEGIKLESVKGLLEFRDVHFRYPSRPDNKVLHGVTFAVSPGQTVALVGHSGCGKSTMIGLLMRYYNQESGSVTLDGVPVQNMNVQWLRNVVGLVSQEPVMFATTIEMNMKLGKLDATQEEIEEACKMANAHDFIMELPAGYNTVVGEGGVKLSGGQKQRLAIARILIRNPKILLLDEATSALDTESERHVQEAIQKASVGRTTVTIAHRLCTVRNADRILVFDHGQIVEAGNHLTLMAKNGVYKGLVMAQQVGNTGNKNDVEDKSEVESSSFHNSLRIIPAVAPPIAPELKVEMDEFPSEVKQIVPPASFLSIVNFARAERILVIMGFIATVVRGCVWPAFSLIYGYLFRILAKALESNNSEVAAMNRDMAISYTVLGVVAGVFTFVAGICLGYTGERVTMRMRLAVFKDSSFFDDQKHSTAKLTARLAIDAPNVQSAIDMRLADCLQGILSLLIGIVIAFVFGWQMSFCGLISAASVVVVQFGLAAVLKRRGAADMEAAEDANRCASESIEFVRTVQALTRQRFMYEVFLHLNVTPYRRGLIRGLLQSVSYGLIAAFLNINFSIAYGLSMWLISLEVTTPFQAFQVVEAMTSGFIAVMASASYFPEYIRATVAAGVMFHMMNRPTKVDNMSDEGLKPNISGNVVFKNCVFGYGNSKKMILNDFNVTVKRGETLALVGPSGCGKSTTIQLLERFYNVNSGEVLIDNQNIAEVNIKHLRKHIALVGQEPVLFNLTIKENILYGMTEKVSDQDIIQAAVLANAHGFISEFPKSYDTPVGPRGSRLSGGQRQRIAIARAMVRNPTILLLDEATSALDTESEKLVQQALEQASKGRTCITIAHRLSTIQHAEKIAVCKEGQVIEEGKHDELVKHHGLYYRLAKKQKA